MLAVTEPPLFAIQVPRVLVLQKARTVRSSSDADGPAAAMLDSAGSTAISPRRNGPGSWPLPPLQVQKTT